MFIICCSEGNLRVFVFYALTFLLSKLLLAVLVPFVVIQIQSFMVKVLSIINFPIWNLMCLK